MEVILGRLIRDSPIGLYKKGKREITMTDIEVINVFDERKCLYSKTCLYRKEKSRDCLKNNIKDLQVENEDLKEKYKWHDHYKESALFNKDLCNKKSDEIYRYKQALDEIKGKAQENDELLQGYHHEWANNKLILEIINEVQKNEFDNEV